MAARCGGFAPLTGRRVLRSRAGHIYDVKRFPKGWGIRKRDDPFLTT